MVIKLRENRGFRFVLPSFGQTPTNKTGSKTPQKWQLEYFFECIELNFKTDLGKANDSTLLMKDK